jgi:hypothetical protein
MSSDMLHPAACRTEMPVLPLRTQWSTDAYPKISSLACVVVLAPEATAVPVPVLRRHLVQRIRGQSRILVNVDQTESGACSKIRCYSVRLKVCDISESYSLPRPRHARSYSSALAEAFGKHCCGGFGNSHGRSAWIAQRSQSNQRQGGRRERTRSYGRAERSRSGGALRSYR